MKTPKISTFLKERPDRFKPIEANKLGLRRLNKIDFSGKIHLVEKPTNTNMILIKSGDLVISGINVEKGALAVYQGEEDILATIHYSSYEFDESKRDIRIALKIFLKWKLGEGRAVDLVGWIDTRRVNKTPDYLKESEVEKLFKACKNAKERFLLALLFDSGTRAEEFLNIRYEDIEMPTNKDNFVRLTLKEEYSKTKGRVISLYWKHSLESVRDYMKEREYSGIKSSDAIFEGSYDSARFFLMRLGKKILKKSIHFHLFRHSSATYYATKLNRQELCYRYGWKFSSDMPDTYISRAGMESKELDEKFQATEIEELQKKFEIQDQQRLIEVEEIKKETEGLKDEIRNEVWEQVKVKMKEMLDNGEIVMKC